MISGNKPPKPPGNPFTLAEPSPKDVRKKVGSLKDTQASRNSGTGGDNASNITPSFEETARSQAAKY